MSLSWHDLSALDHGARVVFVEPLDRFPHPSIPAGTTATVVNNELNEISCVMGIEPDDADLRATLKAWDGYIMLTGDDFDWSDDTPEHDPWKTNSPVAVLKPEDDPRFQRFLASRKWCEDLTKIDQDMFEAHDYKPCGYSYLDSLYIEQVNDHWPQTARDAGQWYLILTRDEYIENDIEKLERTLFDWANTSGYLD